MTKNQLSYAEVMHILDSGAYSQADVAQYLDTIERYNQELHRIIIEKTDIIHRRNMQIKDLKQAVKDAREFYEGIAKIHPSNNDNPLQVINKIEKKSEFLRGLNLDKIPFNQ